MDPQQLKSIKTRQDGKGVTPGADRPAVKLPTRLDQLEKLARQVFVPRVESIVKVMLDQQSTINVKRGELEGCPGEVIVDLMFGRKDTPDKRWSAYLVRMELDPFTNQVCIQAGMNLHMNRQFTFGDKDWNRQLIDGFEWVLSSSMRSHLRISS